MDGSSVYTDKDVNDDYIEGDPSLYTLVIMPKDICTAMAYETNGTMFVTSKFIFPKPIVQKKFRDVFARRIAKTAIPNDCQTCVCSETERGDAISTCRPCEMPKPLSFVKMFPEEYNYEDDDDDNDDENQSPKKLKSKVRRKKKNRAKLNRDLKKAARRGKHTTFF